MKYVVFVEGDVEKRVLSPFLRQWLDTGTTRRVGVQVFRFQGVSEFTKKVPDAARRHLAGPRQANIIAAIGVIDLYGVDYYPSSLSSVDERYDWLCEYFHQKVNHTKFRMYCAVHELEAWILSQPQLLPPAVRRALPGRIQNPEDVNFDEPPSKLLRRLYREKLQTRYKKTVDGTNLFAKLDPVRAGSMSVSKNNAGRNFGSCNCIWLLAQLVRRAAPWRKPAAQGTPSPLN